MMTLPAAASGKCLLPSLNRQTPHLQAVTRRDWLFAGAHLPLRTEYAAEGPLMLALREEPNRHLHRHPDV